MNTATVLPPKKTNPGDKGTSFARAVSFVLHPISMGVISFLLVGTLGVRPFAAGIAWAMFFIFVVVAVPTAFYFIRMSQGKYSNSDIAIRQERYELYFFNTAFLLIMILILRYFTVPRPFVALLCSLFTLLVACMTINFFWKISVHSLAAAMAATIAVVFIHKVWPICIALLVLLGWARIRTHNHTLMQVLAGYLLSIIAIAGVFFLFHLV